MSNNFFRAGFLLIISIGFGLIGIAGAEEETQKLPDITVTAERIDPRTIPLDKSAETASRLGVPIKDIPASIEVINQETIRERGDRTVLEAAEKATGFSSGHTPGTPGSFSVRGFTTNGVAWLYNGVRIPGGSSMSARILDASNFERIEILRGPASVLYGEGSIGAAINLISRTPNFNEQPIEVDYAFSSFNSHRFHAGTGGAIRNDVAAYRVDVSTNRYGSDAEDERTTLDRLTASLLYKPADNLSLTLEADRMEDDADNIYYGTPLVNGRIDESLRGINYNNLTDNIYGSHTTWLRANLEWKASSDWKVRNQLYYYDSYREWRNVEKYAYNAGASPTVTRQWWGDLDHDHELLGNRFEVLYVGRIASLDHRFLVGSEISTVDFQTNRNGFPGSDTVDAYNPAEINFISAAGKYSSLARDTQIDQWSVFAEDLLSITKEFKVVIGLRHDSFDTSWTYFDQTGTPTETEEHTFTTWRIGAVYDVIKNMTLYASYATAVEPGATLLLLNRNQSQLDLTTAYQFEAGVKQSFWGNKGEYTLALYDITKENVFVPDPAAPSNRLAVGQQSSRGVEFDLGLRPTDQWQIDANAAIVYARYDDYSTGNPPVSYNDNIPPFVPKWVANLGVQYLPTEKWRFGAWIRHVDSVFMNDANTLELSDYTTLDISALCKLTKNIDIGLRVRNITDELYAQWYYSEQVLIADPRTYELSLHMRF